METFSALLAICAGNSPVPGEFPTQRPVTRSFDAYFDLGRNKRLSKQSWGWWFETPSCPFWRHRNGVIRADYLLGGPILQGSLFSCAHQWETTLHCNIVFHWLGAHTKWSLWWEANCPMSPRIISGHYKWSLSGHQWMVLLQIWGHTGIWRIDK